MCRMTIQAVFPDRRMLPKHGAAFFLVTIETKLIDRQITEQGCGDRAMRIMTIGTVQFAFQQWHVGAFIELGSLLLVTVETGVIDTVGHHQAST